MHVLNVNVQLKEEDINRNQFFWFLFFCELLDCFCIYYIVGMLKLTNFWVKTTKNKKMFNKF